MEVKNIQLVSPLLEEVEAAAQELIEDPALNEVQVSQGLSVIRGSEDLTKYDVFSGYQKGNLTFVVIIGKR